MENMNYSITFTCPGCFETLQFDNVGEYQLVTSPIVAATLLLIEKTNHFCLSIFRLIYKSQKIEMKPLYR